MQPESGVYQELVQEIESLQELLRENTALRAQVEALRAEEAEVDARIAASKTDKQKKKRPRRGNGQAVGGA